MDFFLIFSIYGFRSSQSTADLLTVVPDKIARAFNRWLLAGATRVVALDRIWHAGLLHKLKYYQIFRSDIWPYSFFSQ